MSELSILIVDDEPDQIELARLHLIKSEPDLTIDIADSATQAFDKVEEKHYDCIILDHVMPGISGLELAKELKRKINTPIILYTAKGSEELASQSADFGVDSYLMKDSDIEHFKILAKRIRSMVDRHNLELIGKAESDYLDVNKSSYPKVLVKGKSIFIVNNEEREELWRTEETYSKARVTAKEIETIIKSINEKRHELSRLMSDMTDIGVPPEYRKDIIERGYGEIKALLNQLITKKTIN
jgi:DNA-binding response OmpR family regulator